VLRPIGANLDLLLEQVLDGRAIQHTLGSFGGFKPRVADRAGSPPVGALGVRRRLVDELVRHDWAFEGGHDVAQRELTWITSQLVAAMWAADTVHNAYPAQATQQLVEVGLRDFLAGSDFGALHRALAETSGKLDNGMGAIVAAHGQPQS
jgi:hypothetical protein